MKIAIIGTGAVGGYYGAKLASAGNDVHFLLHSDYDFVSQNGLLVEMKDGTIRQPHANVWKSTCDMPPCDLAIVALKTTANHLLPELLAPFVRNGTDILTLQNGLGSDDAIADIVGPDRVFGGLCFICSNKIGPGHIRHLDYGAVTLGQYAPDNGKRGITPRLQKLSAVFSQAKIEAHLVDDLVLGRWKKLIWNIPYNGMPVVMNATTDIMVRDPLLRPLFRELMEETQCGAAALGRNIPSAFLDEMVAATDRMTPYATSMMLDFLNKRPMEVDAIYGEPLRRAAAFGVEMPRVEMLWRELCHINARLSSKQSA